MSNVWDEVEQSSQVQETPAAPVQPVHVAPPPPIRPIAAVPAMSFQAGQLSVFDPKESVMMTSPVSLRVNRYQKDIISAASRQMGVTKQEFIRQAILTHAREKMNIY